MDVHVIFFIRVALDLLTKNQYIQPISLKLLIFYKIQICTIKYLQFFINVTITKTYTFPTAFSLKLQLNDSYI